MQEPLIFKLTSLVYSDAPTSSTASTQSVTFGSNFKVQYYLACAYFTVMLLCNALFL